MAVDYSERAAEELLEVLVPPPSRNLSLEVRSPAPRELSVARLPAVYSEEQRVKLLLLVLAFLEELQPRLDQVCSENLRHLAETRPVFSEARLLPQLPLLPSSEVLPAPPPSVSPQHLVSQLLLKHNRPLAPRYLVRLGPLCSVRSRPYQPAHSELRLPPAPPQFLVNHPALRLCLVELPPQPLKHLPSSANLQLTSPAPYSLPVQHSPLHLCLEIPRPARHPPQPSPTLGLGNQAQLSPHLL